MIHKNHLLIPCMFFTCIISTHPEHVIIEIDDERTEQQESLLQEKRNIKNSIKQKHNQQLAKYDEITNCCCLSILCLPCVTTFMEPFTTIPADEISLLGAFSAGAVILAIDRYNQPDYSQHQMKINEIDNALKEKID